ncbi:hypothetical protein HII13_005014 [Brettanomyces bruxellensis]|uniref:Ataxin-10 homolog n=1 Tax=Dekkera bruxellensis TaxID=5007 RepID=A0A7D9H310_DEKBR|nr:hypothetical protein HII13_005014 [Brettanomyces bruxellensis]VUG20220.1 DEBR0S6_10660g1_1 [Brettanomyces bruxellensis]
MSLGQCSLLDVLIRCQDLLKSDEQLDISVYLQHLSSWIQNSASNENNRVQLAKNKSLITQISKIIGLATHNIIINENGGLNVPKLRVLRGVVILFRNLIPDIIRNETMKMDEIEHLIWQLITGGSRHIDQSNRQIVLRTITSCLQCLCNAKTAQAQISTNGKDINEGESLQITGGIKTISQIPIHNSKDQEELWVGLLTLIAKCETSDEFTTNWISIYYVSFKQFTTSYRALSYEYGWKEKETDQDELPDASAFTLLGLHVFLKVITNARCLNLVEKLNEESRPDPLLELLRMTQILSEGKEEGWTEDELRSVSSWLMEYTKSLLKSIENESGGLEQILKQYERRLASTLDSISSLMKFPFVVKQMNSYHFLDTVLDLFKIICRRPKKGNFDEARTNFDGENKAGIKGIIIEIISYLVSGNHANQEQVRKQHCLELVLDSSNLDLEEPFIRERAILCIRALLDRNRGNQDFIANLEVKGAKIDEKSRRMLEDCGYKVNIVDGKVKLTAMGGDFEGGKIHEITEHQGQ